MAHYKLVMLSENRGSERPSLFTEKLLRRKKEGCVEEKRMEQKKMDKLYELLEQAEKRKDTDAVAALRWAIIQLERR